MKAWLSQVKNNAFSREFRVYVIESSTLKRFVIVEIVLGTLAYHAAFYLVHNALLAGVGSWAGTEGMKRLPAVVRRIVSV